MISKNKNTQIIEAKLNLDLANKAFLTAVFLLVSINFIENNVGTIITLICSVVMMFLAIKTKKESLEFLDKLEAEDL